MKRKLVILALSLFAVVGMSLGQNYTFKVLVNKGANKVKSGSEWQPIKTGASLNTTDEISIVDNAYLGLVHSNGKTLELKESGNYKVTDLTAKVSGGGSSVASKYADFVLSKMSAEGKKNRLSATGAVHRGIEDKIKVYMPNTVGVFNDEAIIRWDSVENDNQIYVVTVTNMFEDVLMTIETDDPSIQLDLSKEKIAKENTVLLSVAPKDDPTKGSEAYALRKLSKADQEKVQSTLNDLMTDVKEQTALNKYILAGFYEENNLLVDALTNYEEAMKLAPDVDSYREAYVEFILRNNLSSE